MSLLRHDFVPQRVDIAVLFVTPDKSQAVQLSKLLGNSPYIKRVEWIDCEQPYEARVKRQLCDRRREEAFIVIVDFKACGPRAWTLLSSAHELIRSGNFEWVITRHAGVIPCLPGVPWHRVTVLKEQLA